MASKPAPSSTLAPLSTVTTTNPSTDSLSTPTQQPETYDPTSTDPFSPFYSHARASESSRRLHPRSSSVSRSHSHADNVHDRDLEKALPVATVTEACKSTLSVTTAPNDLNKPSLLCKCSAKKTGGWWRNMSKKQRMGE
ncbi:MAG: hypothetical protein LQ346_001975 [Caloplaca aetnensis]|nr:MAG: hypothetical protein LQ346_001975 [Caloplaca aetnensis]